MTHFHVTMMIRTPDGDAQPEDTLEVQAYSEEDAIIQAVRSRKSRRIRATHRGTVPERLAGVEVVRTGGEDCRPQAGGWTPDLQSPA